MRMLTFRSAAERALRHPSPAPLVVAVSVAAVLAGAAFGQSSSPFGATTPATPPATSPFGSTVPPGAPPATRPAPAARPTPGTVAAPQVIARVEGRDITMAQFDAIARPYLARLRTEMAAGFNADVQKLARRNVFAELVRREVLGVEAQRQKIAVSDDDIDALLRSDPGLQTNGRFDPAKLRDWKLSPQSNYAQLLPRLRETAATAKLDRQLRERFQPSSAQLHAEFEKRNAQARFRFLALQTRDITLEPEASEREWRAYYDAHPGEFSRRAQMRLRWFRLALPAATDSGRAAAEASALERAGRMADSLRAGTLADSSADSQDTGLFDVGAAVVPGLGRDAALQAAIVRADSLTATTVIGPVRLHDAIVVAKVVERRPRVLPPFGEVVADAKRRADIEKRKTAAEADRRAYFAANLERYRGTRARLTRLTLRMGAYAGRAIAPEEVDRWYQRNGRRMFGLADTSRAWLPPMDHSRRREAGRMMAEEERDRWLATTMDKLANALVGSRDLFAFARDNGAAAETLSLVAGMPADSLFPAFIADSIRTTAWASRGQVHGPRAFGAYSTVWRVDAVDTAYTPTFEAARSRVESDFGVERRRKDDEAGRAWFEQHRGDYMAPPRYVVDYVAVPQPPPDSMRITEADLRADYGRNLARYREEEQVRARHVLLSTRDGGPDADARAATRADSLLAAIRKGADFVEIAKRFSQEPGAATSGGDLGWFGRGRMVPEFERAAFALKAGEVSGVVKTQFGYHIIRLEERKPAATKPFAQVRDEIRGTLAAARADTSARRAAEALRRKLPRTADLKTLAAPYGGVQTSAPFAVNETVGALGVVPGLAEDLAALPAGQWAARLYRAGTRYVLVRPLNTIASRPAEFEEVRGKAVEDEKNARRKLKLDQKVAALRSALAAGARLDSLALPLGGLKDSGPVNRDFGFVPGLGLEPRLVQRVFGAEKGAVSDTVLIAQGVVWFESQGRDMPDAKAFAAAEPQLAQELLKRDYDAWLESRKKLLRIEILRAEFRGGR